MGGWGRRLGWWGLSGISYLLLSPPTSPSLPPSLAIWSIIFAQFITLFFLTFRNNVSAYITVTVCCVTVIIFTENSTANLQNFVGVNLTQQNASSHSVISPSLLFHFFYVTVFLFHCPFPSWGHFTVCTTPITYREQWQITKTHGYWNITSCIRVLSGIVKYWHFQTYGAVIFYLKPSHVPWRGREENGTYFDTWTIEIV